MPSDIFESLRERYRVRMYVHPSFLGGARLDGGMPLLTRYSVSSSGARCGETCFETRRAAVACRWLRCELHWPHVVSLTAWEIRASSQPPTRLDRCNYAVLPASSRHAAVCSGEFCLSISTSACHVTSCKQRALYWPRACHRAQFIGWLSSSAN